MTGQHQFHHIRAVFGETGLPCRDGILLRRLSIDLCCFYQRILFRCEIESRNAGKSIIRADFIFFL